MTKCKISDNCGGCLYQGMSYEEQLAAKDKSIRRLFDKHDFSLDIFEVIVPAITPYGYRNKMEYTFGDLDKGGPLELGMHMKGRFMSIISCDMCQLVPEDFNIILRATLEFCRDRGYTFYHRKSHAGLLRNLVLRHGVKSGEILVNIVTSSQDGSNPAKPETTFPIEGLEEDRSCDSFDEDAYLKLLQSLEVENEIVGVIRTYNDSVADAVINEGIKIIYGRDYYNEEILGLKFKVNAFSFFQTNIPAIERLYSDALSLIPDIDDKTVYDLYCGTGTISQLMAIKAREVYGVEIVEDSVNAAIDNAVLNGITNCHFICGDVKQVLDELPKKPDVIVVDPPRVGMHDKVVDMLSGYGIKQILYISCNPKTMFINLERFRFHGYEPISIRAYDNFPLTKHVETVCLLQKMSNTRERTITLDVEMEDYHRIKNGTEVTADATE